MKAKTKKPVTLDSLALMVGQGFNHVQEQFQGVNQRLDKVELRMGGLEDRMDSLEHKMEALNSTVNNYLELSEKRYLELKQRDAVLAKWLQLLANKIKVPIDVSQLERL